MATAQHDSRNGIFLRRGAGRTFLQTGPPRRTLTGNFQVRGVPAELLQSPCIRSRRGALPCYPSGQHGGSTFTFCLSHDSAADQVFQGLGVIVAHPDSYETRAGVRQLNSGERIEGFSRLKVLHHGSCGPVHSPGDAQPRKHIDYKEKNDTQQYLNAIGHGDINVPSNW